MISFFLAVLLSVGFSAPSYFKDNYSHSRADFTQFSAAWSSGKLSHGTPFKVPSEKDPDLTVDSILIGNASDKNLVVIVSGVHGPETFASSAIQHFFLNEKAELFVKKNVSLLLIHAMNPYGFKYGRRVTEANVDLNRNFFIPDKDFTTYEALNPSFKSLKAYLDPNSKASGQLFSFLRLAQGLIGELLLGDLGRKGLNNAIAGGQYEFPKAIFFGGHKLEPQSEWLRDLLRQVFAGRERIVVLDLHTGLGDRGVLHLITGESENHIGQVLGPQFMTFMKNKEEIRLTTASTPGFYKTRGDLLDFTHYLTRPEQKLVGLTLEYGTMGSGLFSQLRSLNRIIMENQGFHYGFASPRIEKEIQKNFSDLFYPQEELWKGQVIDRADLFFTELLATFP